MTYSYSLCVWVVRRVLLYGGAVHHAALLVPISELIGGVCSYASYANTSNDRNAVY